MRCLIGRCQRSSRDQLEIRTTPDGTVYYRDYEHPFEPNTPTHDNLLSLPRYTHVEA